MSLDEALARLERDGAQHLTQRCSEPELDAFERTLGLRLPADFRRLLARIGFGILYDRHEVYGTRPLILHDIEMVPDILAIRRRLEQEGRPCPERLVPFHRTRGVLHLLDVSGDEGAAPVRSETGQAYADLADFLRQVVLPASGQASLDVP
jgi:hypothetical protein